MYLLAAPAPAEVRHQIVSGLHPALRRRFAGLRTRESGQREAQIVSFQGQVASVADLDGGHRARRQVTCYRAACGSSSQLRVATGNAKWCARTDVDLKDVARELLEQIRSVARADGVLVLLLGLLLLLDDGLDRPAVDVGREGKDSGALLHGVDIGGLERVGRRVDEALGHCDLGPGLHNRDVDLARCQGETRTLVVETSALRHVSTISQVPTME